MSETSFVKKLRRQADAVYLTCEVDVAKDISDSLKLAADLLALRPEAAPRILDEREVIALAKKLDMPREMWGSPETRMALANFANEAQRGPQKEGS